MVSQLKSDTARANGAKSRGPTTAEGKEKSSRNALQHGLTASNGNILLDCEDPTQFDEFFSKFLGIHEPATPAEKDIVEEMIAARWRIRRMLTIETGLLNAEILTQQSKSESPDPTVHLASAFRSLSDDSRSLALASRYEARLQRLYDRAYKTLREVQQARKSEEPQQSDNIRIRWVDPEEALQMRAAQEHHNPSVSAGNGPYNPSVSAGNGPYNPSVSAGNGPYSPSVSAGAMEPPTPPCEPAPHTELRNEPTAPATKQVIDQQLTENIPPPESEPPTSEIQHPTFNSGIRKSS
jgi:hypothetical protein